MTSAPNRGWFRFSLRTLFVVVTVVCCWLAYELNWIRQRRALLAKHAEIARESLAPPVPMHGSKSPSRAPGLLWLFGEPSYGAVQLVFPTAPDIHRTQAEEDAESSFAERLFPEATVWSTRIGVPAKSDRGR